MTKFIATTALVATAAIAAPATANTVLLEYDGKGVEVKNDEQTYDFFNLGPSTHQPVPYTAMTVQGPVDGMQDMTPIGVREAFRPDGRADILIETTEDEMGGDGRPGFGRVSFLDQNNRPEEEMADFEVFALQTSPMDAYMQIMPEFDILDVFQRASFATVSEIDAPQRLATFGADGMDGNLVDDSFDYFADTAFLYGGKGPDLLQAEGDSAILGFRIEVIAGDLWLQDSVYNQEIICDLDFVIDDAPQMCGPQEEVLATFFGFLEVTRGSVTPGILGVNTQSGAAAVVPSPNAVPLPASVLLLGAGLGGLGAMRRRQKS